MNFAQPTKTLAHSLLCLVFTALIPVSATEKSTAGQSQPQPQPKCESPRLLRDTLTMVCSLAPAAASQSIHIKVHFVGSHDDTNAALEVTLGDVPVVCTAGSKTSTEAEDGDVTLDCRMTAFVKPGSAAVLRASAKWFHAQYVGIEVNRLRP